MKTTLVIATMAAAAFVAGMMTSCSSSTMAPTSVAPIPQGSYTIGGTK